MKRFAIAVLAALSFGGAAGAADVSAGERIFAQRCATCHMIVAPSGETIVKGGKTGPNQFGLIGRTAGTSADFQRYGDELKAAGAKGLVWDEAQVVAYLEDPVKFLRDYLGDARARSRMAFKLADLTDRQNVAAYLATMK